MNFNRNKRKRKSTGFSTTRTERTARPTGSEGFGSRPPRTRTNGNNNNRRSRRPGSTLDPNTLVRRSSREEQKEFTASYTFNQMDLNPNLLANLARKGFTLPTQIQEATIKPLMEGRDLVGVANTGTGKTSAFLIPIIEKLIGGQHQKFTTLVVVPTRELALQVTEEFRSLTQGLGLFASCFIGGTSVGKDINQLRRKSDLIVGTPGRLMDLADRGSLRFGDISVLVLDEFDRMLDMGFVTDINKIVKAMTRREQTMLFSATIDRTQKSLISKLLRDPIEVKVSRPASDQIEQEIIRVPHGSDKFDMLLDLLDDSSFEKVLIFAETKRLVDKVNKRLRQSGVTSDLIHGNKSQNYRINALNKFKRGNVKVLVATDVAARGIDVTDVTHVINYQLPMTMDSYTHRIGRTGRAGKMGKAFTFVD